MTGWEFVSLMVGAWGVAIFGADGNANAVASAIGMTLVGLGFLLWQRRKEKKRAGC